MNKLLSVICALFFSVSLQAFGSIGDIVIEGKIEKKNDGEQYLLKASDFNKMSKSNIKTTTSWTDAGRQVNFEGVKVKDILNLVGAHGSTLRMSALNDYWVDIPISDVNKYGIILANKMDGVGLRVRNFGPYFVIYPLDEHPTLLNSPLYLSRFIWQVNKITVI
ncbi:oxidoreductase [Serratia ficaria]|uniref:oxidoreductase n=1 Tax=Serratia ficaria TaxID=61651 RepID=UPI00077C8231|nr:oxidoreductase [Serratia ficaria]